MSKVVKDGGSTVIGVLSGKGGVGKTTLVSNLGAALASDFNRKVLIVDSNVKTSHLGLHLGIYEELPVTLKEVLQKKVPVLYAVFLHPETGLRLLPAPIKGDMSLKSMDDVVKELKASYNPIIIDCAPGLGKDVLIAAKAIDKALLITTPDLPSVTDLLKTINLLKRLKKDVMGVVLNRVTNEKYELTVEEVESTCGHKVVAAIPESNKIPYSIAQGLPLAARSDCAAAVEFKKLAASLIGKEYRPVGFWYRLKRFFDIRGKAGLKVSKEKKEKKEGKEREERKERKEKPAEERPVEDERAALEELKKDLRRELETRKKSKR